MPVPEEQINGQTNSMESRGLPNDFGPGLTDTDFNTLGNKGIEDGLRIKIPSWYPEDKRLSRVDPGGKIIVPFLMDDNQLSTQGILDGEGSKNEPNMYGVPALMNDFAIVMLSGASSEGGGKDNRLLIDKEKNERFWYEGDTSGFKSKHVTVGNLINWSQSAERKAKRPYSYSDFVYLKHFTKIPLNHLITLRRYPYPVNDGLWFPQEGTKSDNIYPPVAQAVTYMGTDTGNDMSSFFDMNFNLNWEEFQAEIWDQNETMPGADSIPGFLGTITKYASLASGQGNADTQANQDRSLPDPYQNGPYANRIMGPVNRIDTTMRRAPGLNFQQSFEIKFDYVAREIGGINTKAAILDILANILALTYGIAPFWGGANRFTVAGPAYPFDGMNSWYDGDAAGFWDSLTTSVGSALDNMGNFFASLLENPKETIKAAIGSAFEGWMAREVRGQKPSYLGIRSILTGEPIGEWHLTIGNPLNPVMEIGNLICTGVNFEVGDELGPDDFPTEFSATISLEHGMPRDSDAISNMFNRGRGRIYTLPDEFTKGLSSSNETKIDKFTGDNNPYLNKVLGSVEDSKKEPGIYGIEKQKNQAAVDNAAKSSKNLLRKISASGNQAYTSAARYAHGWNREKGKKVETKKA